MDPDTINSVLLGIHVDKKYESKKVLQVYLNSMRFNKPIIFCSQTVLIELYRLTVLHCYVLQLLYEVFLPS